MKMHQKCTERLQALRIINLCFPVHSLWINVKLYIWLHHNTDSYLADFCLQREFIFINTCTRLAVFSFSLFSFPILLHCVWSFNTDSVSVRITQQRKLEAQPLTLKLVYNCGIITSSGPLESVRLQPVTEFPAERRQYSYLVTQTHTVQPRMRRGNT